MDTILNRPEFRHALFGIEIYSLTDNKVLYALNADNALAEIAAAAYY
jgi:hypothetical protein